MPQHITIRLNILLLFTIMVKRMRMLNVSKEEKRTDCEDGDSDIDW
jgi:hypothetical protein